MDFNKYYIDQAEGNHFPVFRGASFQTGYGLGGYFKQFFKWAIPLLRQYALPVAKTFGKEVISNVSNVANDAIDGKDLTNSVKENIEKSIKKLTNQSGSGLNLRKKGYKRKRKIRNLKNFSKNKKYLDIFN